MEKIDPRDESPNSRRNFLKKIAIGAGVLAATPSVLANSFEQAGYTELVKTNEKFKNGEFVYLVKYEGQEVGEFWPIHGINLVTKETDPDVFNGTTEEIIDKLDGVATAPDGMSAGVVGGYKMEGKALAKGRECGDGYVYNYGIIHVKGGYDINFTHKLEIDDFEKFYNDAKENKDTIFFLPSLYREGKFLDSQKMVDKVLLRREVPDGEQIGVVIFDKQITYNEARETILGLDRQGKSKTTHIYMLDGGGTWGQSAKEVNGQKKIQGTRDPEAVTNYLVFY